MARIITINDLEQTKTIVMNDYDKYRLSLTKQYSDISQHVMRNIINNREKTDYQISQRIFI